MQKEFHSHPEFQEWYSKKQIQMNKDPLFTLFKNSRNESLKVRPVAKTIKIMTKLDLTVGPNQTVDIPLLKVDENSNVILKNGEPIIIDNQSSDKTTDTSYFYFFEERPDEDLADLAKRFLSSLVNIVSEWFSKIGYDIT